MLILYRNHKNLVPAFGLILFIGLTSSAEAQTMQAPPTSSPSAKSEVQGATTGLGSSHRFKTTADATSHCPNDTVIWSAGPALTYDLPGSANYGKGEGFYACKAEADSAGLQQAGH